MPNMTEKILWAKAGRPLKAGEVAFVDVDVVMTHDVGTAGVAPILDRFGVKELAKGVEMVVILDHFVPACTVMHAQSHVATRDFVKKWKVENFYEIGRGGICHQVMLEDGFACSGNLVIATDAHVTTYGGAGCLGLGVGVTDVAMTLTTGKMWIKMPKVIGIELKNSLKGTASAKDLAIQLLRDLPFDELNYAVVEFYGDGVKNLSMDGRFSLCNMLSEGGIKSALVACDEKTERYMQAHAKGNYDLVVPDEGAAYGKKLTIDLSKVVPMVACPSHPSNGTKLTDVLGKPINQAFIGSCTNGRLEDLRIVAEVLKGKHVADHVRLIVTPSSQQVYKQAIAEGLIDIFIDAGAMITNPSCGACIGSSSVMAPGEVCISTSNRNFRGRMGSVDAEIYLASPATVAVSSIFGCIHE